MTSDTSRPALATQRSVQWGLAGPAEDTRDATVGAPSCRWHDLPVLRGHSSGCAVLAMT